MISVNPKPTQSFRRRRRNPRAINSCLECRERKSKCSKSYPCESCVAFGRECVFIRDPGLERKRKQLEEDEDAPAKSAEDHHILEREETPPRDFEWEVYQQDVQQEPPLWENLTSNATPIVQEESSLGDGADDEDHEEVILKLGRMVITQRIDGLTLSHYVKELDKILGNTAPKDGANLVAHELSVSFDSDLRPARSTLLIPSKDGSKSTRAAGGKFEMSKEDADILYEQYLKCVDPIVHVLHAPSFRKLFNEFWTRGPETRNGLDSHKALISAVAFAAGVSMPPMLSMVKFGIPKDVLVQRLEEMTEEALLQANCLSSSNLITLQAFTLYLILQCRAEISRIHAAFVAALIRLAQGLGIHRASAMTSLTPLQAQINSLLWYHICSLDVKTAEALGLPTVLRVEDFDVPLPLNMDDAFFEVPQWQPNSVQAWTTVTLSLIRFECNELRRRILRGVLELGHKAVPLDELKRQSEAHKTQISRKYLTLIDQSVPIQRCAGHVAKLLMARCDLLLLSRLLPKHDRTEAEMRLRDILIRAALFTLEVGATLETDPDLAPFAWYAGAYQQYQDVLFLMTELLKTPDHPDAHRICVIMDHVFGHCYGARGGPTNRCRDILSVVKDSLETIQNLKRPKPKQESKKAKVGINIGMGIPQNDAMMIPWIWDEQTKPNPTGPDLDNLLNAYQQPQPPLDLLATTSPDLMDGIFVPTTSSDPLNDFNQAQAFAPIGTDQMVPDSSFQWSQPPFVR